MLGSTLGSGGLEMLFDNKRKLSITVPVKSKDGGNTNIADLVRHLCENIMKDPRKELFILDGTVYVARILDNSLPFSAL